jgi:hypothetical protein
MAQERLAQELKALLLRLNQPQGNGGEGTFQPFAEADLSKLLSLVAKGLEPRHAGNYAMINSINGDYVVAPTISEVHTRFIDAFGLEAPGLCLRVGASPFAAA